MRAYMIRRLLLIIPTLFILTLLVFFAVRFIPGDIIDQMMYMHDEMLYGDFDRATMERLLGLDVPAYVQYGRWIGVLPTPDPITGESHFEGLFQGTFGKPIKGGLPIEQQIIERLPVTIELGFLAIVIGLVIALPVGIYSAIRQDTAADYVGRTAAIIGMSTPNFWLALMVMIYPANLVGLVATAGIHSSRGRPAEESRGAHHSQPDSGDGLFCRHHAVDAHHDAGGTEAGLYQDGLVQGSQGEGSDNQTRPQECVHPDTYLDRGAAALDGRWLRYHGEHI